MGRIARTRIQPRAVQIKTGFPQLPYRSRFATAVSKMARPNTKRLLPILLATAARALLPPRQHRISMRRAPPCQPKRRRTKAPNAAARTAPTRQTTALSASKDETVGKIGAVIVDAEAGFIDGAAGPAAAAAPQPTAMDAVTLVAVAAPPAKTKPKPDKKRQQAKSPQSLKVAAATIALAATAPVPTTLFAWHPALAALSQPPAPSHRKGGERGVLSRNLFERARKDALAVRIGGRSATSSSVAQSRQNPPSTSELMA